MFKKLNPSVELYNYIVTVFTCAVKIKNAIAELKMQEAPLRLATTTRAIPILHVGIFYGT